MRPAKIKQSWDTGVSSNFGDITSLNLKGNKRNFSVIQIQFEQKVTLCTSRIVSDFSISMVSFLFVVFTTTFIVFSSSAMFPLDNDFSKKPKTITSYQVQTAQPSTPSYFFVLVPSPTQWYSFLFSIFLVLGTNALVHNISP